MGVLADSIAMETAVWITLTVAIVGILAEVVMSICLYVVAQRAKKVDTLESRLEQSANEKIEAKFAAMESKLLLPINGLKTMLDETQRRLGRGDEHFDDLNDRDRKLETALLSKLSEMKDWMHETFATKRDYETVLGRFDGFQRFIAKMETEGHGQ